MRETLVVAEPIEIKGPKQYRVYEKSNLTFKDWQKEEEKYPRKSIILNISLRAKLDINILGDVEPRPKGC